MAKSKKGTMKTAPIKKDFENPLAGFENPLAGKTGLETILARAKTDGAFYQSLVSDFETAIAPYRLTSKEVTTLTSKMDAIKPPEGTKSASYTKAQLRPNPDDLNK